MKQEVDVITINGVEYVRSDKVQEKEMSADNYVIIRTYSAGVFAGHLVSRDGQECVLKNARRLWYWDGSASLSELAMSGTSKPENCKFPCEVDSITLTQVIEIIPCTKKAQESIRKVKIWSAQ